MLPTLFDKDFFPNMISGRFPSLNFNLSDFLTFPRNQGLTISEGPQDITVLADMPGLEASDVEVKLENGLLQIQGQKKQEVQDQDRRFYSQSTRNYRFVVDLPAPVDESKVDAFLDDKGVMHVIIPKTQQTQSKKITVRESKEQKQEKGKQNRESRDENQEREKNKQNK